ncbi:Crp/Fnr family transcriptional regulator [uncultured Chitinophaga sp.]|jgi:Cyclic nucleotide-binding domain.|uniref:Crp/Fnr family transcriptional regulator n=1 Tax=uncultured Chitinophaga sp. TaxID=339340 RepID=UPI002633EF70|nr:Crp/Fnr family transcriptional regulator [uncultured Chitinophaga sp.]
MVEKITDFLLDISWFPESVVQSLHGMVHIDEYPTKQKLLSPGQISSRVYFILQGLIRAYEEDHSGESTIWMMAEGDVVFSVRSFYHREPSKQYIETLEPAILGSISYDELQRIYKESLEFNVVGRILNERYNVLAEDRANILRKHDAMERFQLFQEYYPNLEKRVPAVYIASYLGMDKDTLYKIRNGKYQAKKKSSIS